MTVLYLSQPQNRIYIRGAYMAEMVNTEPFDLIRIMPS